MKILTQLLTTNRQNNQRATIAFETLQHFSKLNNDEVSSVETKLTDLLTNLHHLADVLNISMVNVNNRARRHYFQEKTQGKADTIVSTSSTTSPQE